MLANPPTPELESAISAATANLIEVRELAVFERVFGGERLPLARLLNHQLKPDTGIPIITTNYDRLVELAVESAGLGADTGFVGGIYGEFNQREAQLSFCRSVIQRGKRATLQYRKRAVISKPHGSIDWYLRGGKPVRYYGSLRGVQRLMITPGRNKFRSGYESPFDAHRERANKAIDAAARFFIAGYGFNDDHLETHLVPAIRSGVPALILAKSLSHAAYDLAMACPNVTALDSAESSGHEAIRVIRGSAVCVLPNAAWWNLENFVSEVLEP